MLHCHVLLLHRMCTFHEDIEYKRYNLSCYDVLSKYYFSNYLKFWSNVYAISFFILMVPLCLNLCILLIHIMLYTNDFNRLYADPGNVLKQSNYNVSVSCKAV